MDKETLEQAFDARFPLEMKEKLRKARVAIAGLGGLGSNIAVMLARSGVGHIRMIDFDVVDVTKLNLVEVTRQKIKMPLKRQMRDL